MYRKGDVRYEPLPLPDRVQMEPEAALRAADSFLAFMRQRHSVRHYSRRDVPEAVIAALLAHLGVLDPGVAARYCGAVQTNCRGLHTGELRLAPGFLARNIG